MLTYWTNFYKTTFYLFCLLLTTALSAQNIATHTSLVAVENLGNHTHKITASVFVGDANTSVFANEIVLTFAYDPALLQPESQITVHYNGMAWFGEVIKTMTDNRNNGILQVRLQRQINDDALVFGEVIALSYIVIDNIGGKNNEINYLPNLQSISTKKSIQISKIQDVLSINTSLSIQGILLFDGAGRMVLAQNDSQENVTVSLSDLPNGVYYIHIVLENNQIVTRKILL